MPQAVSETIIKILPKGLITIPKKYRDQLGFTDNGLAKAKIQRGKLTLEPIRTISYPVRTYTDKEIQEFLELDKLDSATQKKAERLLRQ